MPWWLPREIVEAWWDQHQILAYSLPMILWAAFFIVSQILAPRPNSAQEVKEDDPLDILRKP